MGLHAFTAGGMGLIPGQENKILPKNRKKIWQIPRLWEKYGSQGQKHDNILQILGPAEKRSTLDRLVTE